MLTKEEINKIKNIALIPVIITLLIMLYYNFINKSKNISLVDNYILGEIAFADSDTTKDIVLKINQFDADLDSSNVIDGRDLAVLAYYFGKKWKWISAEQF